MRQPMTKREKYILAFTTGIAAAGIAVTAGLYYKAINTPPEKPWPKEIVITPACVAGGYQRSNDTYVMDIYIPDRGVETIEGLHQSTYDLITETLGTCNA
jgi:hypothetical protein